MARTCTAREGEKSCPQHPLTRDQTSNHTSPSSPHGGKRQRPEETEELIIIKNNKNSFTEAETAVITGRFHDVCVLPVIYYARP